METAPGGGQGDNAVCALVSGGLDSAVLTWVCSQNSTAVQPVYVHSGMKWEGVELTWMRRFLDRTQLPGVYPIHELRLPVDDILRTHWSMGGAGRPGYDAANNADFLPGRNIVLIAKTALFCAVNDIHRIAIGTLASNPFPDATVAFFAAWASALSNDLSFHLRIEHPFRELHKADVVRLGADLPLELTFTCNNPAGELHCGDCNKCAERQEGFRDAGVADPTTYATNGG